MDLLAQALVTGLAAFFAFYAVNHAPFLAPLQRLLQHLHPMLPRCQWCLGFWLAAPIALAVAPITWRTVPLALAGAAVCGLIGSLVPDEDTVDA